jgi:GNAT superfamily N-acetyltransferase
VTLTEHLRQWLGAWPPTGPLDVVGAPQRALPGWDGRLHPALGIGSPEGAVLSVAPEHRARVAALTLPTTEADSARARIPTGADSALAHMSTGADSGVARIPTGADSGVARVPTGADSALARVPALVGYGERGWFEAVYRWCSRPADLPDADVWIPAADAPAWLRPFGGEVLVVVDPETGAHLAGVGVKRHDAYGMELSVVTAPEARGRGLARRLVAQAARRVSDEGAVPTYMHDPGNLASAAVAEAAGFPDVGWRAFGVTEGLR